VTEHSRWHEVTVDGRVFPLDVILKATYWLTGRYEVDLRQDDAASCVTVRVAALGDPLSPEAARDVETRLRRDLIDFRTRALIEQETHTLRELLVAKAFDDGAP
jgi:His-Xaa-Ser system protein HxsD